VLGPGLSGITQIAQGSDHMLAAGADGVVWAWGRNDYGQLGDGTTTERTSPVPVPGLTGITQLAAGDNHSLALALRRHRLVLGQTDGSLASAGIRGEGAMAARCVTDWARPQVQGSTLAVPITSWEQIVQVMPDGDLQNIRGGS
jgi:alpha-tubulin suppressor-like RCC1 family protein